MNMSFDRKVFINMNSVLGTLDHNTHSDQFAKPSVWCIYLQNLVVKVQVLLAKWQLTHHQV